MKPKENDQLTKLRVQNKSLFDQVIKQQDQIQQLSNSHQKQLQLYIQQINDLKGIETKPHNKLIETEKLVIELQEALRYQVNKQYDSIMMQKEIEKLKKENSDLKRQF